MKKFTHSWIWGLIGFAVGASGVYFTSAAKLIHVAFGGGGGGGF